MQLPFTTEQFYGVFREYNEALWPAQVFLVGLAVIAVVLVFVPSRKSGVGVSAILAFLWAWLALAYHRPFFARINPLAYVFSCVSLVGALIFLWQGVVRGRLQFIWGGGMRAAVGVTLVVFALVVYPVWSCYAGHRYPTMPTFGLPCPTTIFTIGLLAFLAVPCPRSPFIVPVLWCFVGAQAAFLLGVPQDLGLIVAGAVGLVLLARSKVSAAGPSIIL
jgi:drug/metabolite transporter (DMT)-like permease